jgi:nucleoside-diphosphate-sugar epimerase
MIGFVGAQLTQLLLDLFPKLRIITTDIVEPPKLTSDERLKVVKCDLGDLKQVEGLFEGEKIGGVFALQYVYTTSNHSSKCWYRSGIMSGGAEANFPLGYAVNVDSHINLLKVSHAHAEQHFKSGPKPRYVFVSSLAVYGGPKARPESLVKPEYVACTTKLSEEKR